MTPAHDTAGKERPLGGWFFFIFKLVLWTAIAYSFAANADIYRQQPRLSGIAYGVNTFLTGSILIAIGRFTLIAIYRRRTKKNKRVRGNYILVINKIATLLKIVFAVLGLIIVFRDRERVVWGKSG